MSTEEFDADSLADYVSSVPEPEDFDHVWRITLEEARAAGRSPRLTRIDCGLPLVDTYDVVYTGFGGEPIRGWYHRPTGAVGDLPIVVDFNGYGGGRGLPHEKMFWALAGYAHLVTDTRGQGGSWGSGGDTADPHGSGSAAPGFMTRGLASFETYYYRRLITDSVLAVDGARVLDGVDPTRVVVAGASQGGGLAVAVSGLVPGLSAVLADVPFLCDIPRGMAVSDTDPYGELVRFLSVRRDIADAAMRTLSYVDGVTHALRATAPALFSVGLRDNVCPPSTCYAAFHAYGGKADVHKELVTYPYNAHEGGGAYQQVRQVAFLKEALAG